MTAGRAGYPARACPAGSRALDSSDAATSSRRSSTCSTAPRPATPCTCSSAARRAWARRGSSTRRSRSRRTAGSRSCAATRSASVTRASRTVRSSSCSVASCRTSAAGRRGASPAARRPTSRASSRPSDPVPADAPVQAEWAQTRLFEALLGPARSGSRRERRSSSSIEDLHWADSATRETLAFLVGGLRAVPRARRARRTGRTSSTGATRSSRGSPSSSGGRPSIASSSSAWTAPAIAELLGAILGAPAPRQLVDDVFERSDGNPFFAEELLAASADGHGARRLATDPARDPARACRAPARARRRDPVRGRGRGSHGRARPPRAGRRAARAAAASTRSEPRSPPTCSSSRPATGRTGTRSGTRSSRRPCTTTSCRASGDACTARSPRRSRQGSRAARRRRPTRAADGGRAPLGARAGGRAGIRRLALGRRRIPRVVRLRRRPARIRDGARPVGPGRGRRGASRRRPRGAAAPGRSGGVSRRRLPARRRAPARRRSPAWTRRPIPRRAGMLREQLGRALYVTGDISGSLEAYRVAAATIPASPPTPERARALSGLGQILMLLARYRESRPLCEEAIAIARAAGDIVQEGHARNTLGLDLVMLGQPDEGLEEMRAALQIARDAARPGRHRSCLREPRRGARRMRPDRPGARDDDRGDRDRHRGRDRLLVRRVHPAGRRRVRLCDRGLGHGRAPAGRGSGDGAGRHRRRRVPPPADAPVPRGQR